MATFNQFDFNKTIRALEQQKQGLPVIIANKAVKFFVRSFTNEGFTNRSFKPWKQVKRRIPGTKEFRYPKKKDLARRTRAILLGKAPRKLLKSVANSFRSASWQQVVLGVDVPYGEYHNDGTDKIPQRQFMGESQVLHADIRETLRQGVLKSLTNK